MARETETHSPRNASETHPFLLAQYNALRDEIIKRVELRFQAVSLTLIVFGTTLSFGLQSHSPSIIFLYPVIAFFLATNWVHNGLAIETAGKYIKDRIESKVGEDNAGWETTVVFESQSQLLRGLGLNLIASGGIFMGTSLMALIVAISFTKFTTSEIILLIFSLICTISSTILLSHYFLQRRPRISIKKPQQIV